jgi:hypothetical protein
MEGGFEEEREEETETGGEEIKALGAGVMEVNGLLAEGIIAAGGSSEPVSPEREELGSGCGSCQKWDIRPAVQSIDGL